MRWGRYTDSGERRSRESLANAVRPSPVDRARKVMDAAGPKGEWRRVVRGKEPDERAGGSSEEVAVDGVKAEYVIAGGCWMGAFDGEDDAAVARDPAEDDAGDAVGRTTTCQLQEHSLFDDPLQVHHHRERRGPAKIVKAQ